MENLSRVYFKVSGIYCIKSLISNEIYVGGSSNLYSRISAHKRGLEKGMHANSYLQNFANKNGISSLTVEILEFCEPADLERRETHYFNSLNCRDRGFNIHTPYRGERIKPISAVKIELHKSTFESRKDILIPIVNKNLLEARQKLKELTEQGIVKRPGNKHSPSVEAKLKMSKAKLGKNTGPDNYGSRPVVQYTLCGEFVREWSCAKEVEKTLKFHAQNIGKVCLGKRPHAHKFIWAFKHQI